MEDLDLNEIKYFEGIDTRYVIDSLTQVISREYIEMLAKKMLDEKIPFTLMILDLDNFKQINDSFGHLSGDYVLQNLGEELKNFCYPKAYVGRYGGDEFLIIVPNLIDYDDVHVFLEHLYERNKIFRKYYNDGLRDIYITATLGSASYPADETNYESLFKKADKALYRGKMKGRNCYIIYVESKHKDIVVQDKSSNSLITCLNSVKRLFDIDKGKKHIIKSAVDFLYSKLHCSNVYFLTNKGTYISNLSNTEKRTKNNYIPHIELLLNGDSIFHDSPLTFYKAQDLALNDYLNEKQVQGMMISKLQTYGKNYGYIIIFEKEITRIWQESEVALLMYLSALLEMELLNSKD